MDNVVQLWNPRSNNQLRRYWICFKDRIVIGGESPEQAGVLTVQPAGADGLSARLQVLGDEFEQTVAPGNDIDVWINGLQLFVGVKAVADERMLVAFGIPRGAKVNLMLEAGVDLETHAMAVTIDDAGRPQEMHGGSTGLCQTRH